MPHPLKDLKFKIVIEKAFAQFSEVSALEPSFEPIEYRENSSPVFHAPNKQGLIKYGPVILKWGLSSDKEFIDWVVNIDKGTIVRKDVTIELKDSEGKNTVAAWKLINAWPSKYKLTDFNTNEDEIAFESIEIQHENLQRDS